MSITERVIELIPEINQRLAHNRPQMAAALGRAGVPITNPELVPQVMFDHADDLFYQQFGQYEPIANSARLILSPHDPKAVIPTQTVIDQALQITDIDQKSGDELDSAISGLAFIVAMEYFASLLYPQDSHEAKVNQVVRLR